MADDMKVPLDSPTAPIGTGMRVPIRAEAMKVVYANFFRVTGTFEELVMDFGLHTGLIAQGQPEPIDLSHRVVMTYPTAKRLLETLARSVYQHEQLLGAIETDPQQRLRAQQHQPGEVRAKQL